MITRQNALILLGSHEYKNDYGVYGTSKSLLILKKTFERLFDSEDFTDLSENRLGKPQLFFDKLSSYCSTKKVVILYFYGHITTRNNEIYLSHKFSNPRKIHSHISLKEICSIKEKNKVSKLIVLLDSPINNSIEYCEGKRIAVINRKTALSHNQWVNGGEYLTGLLVETFENLVTYIPSFNFYSLLEIVTKKIKFKVPEDCFNIAGDANVLYTNLKFKQASNFKIWNKDKNNFGSLNKGSREDGIQNLYESRIKDKDINGIKFIAEYFAYTDKEANVRKSAISFLKNQQVWINTAESYKLCKEIGKIDFNWKLISAGEFMMGSDTNIDEFTLSQEQPYHSVYLEEFEMSQFQITNSIFDIYKHANGFRSSKAESDLPIVNVSWYEAIEFCKWLTFQLRTQSLIKLEEFILLPSEAQWEKAARGPYGLIYPWGNTFKENYCNCRNTNFNKVVEVGTFSPRGDSPFGLSDMAGNVWEWTTSIWGRSGRVPDFKYPYNPKDGRENMTLGNEYRRVVRGGAYYYFDYCVRTATRNIIYPITKHSGGGFRIIKKAISYEDFET